MFLAILVSCIVLILTFCNCFAKVHMKEGKKEQNNETGEATNCERRQKAKN
jgi:hypothetical protein